ncbi:MAG: hypothetical protein V1772_00570, partial [Chloroflexota bacterium]
MSLRRLLIMWVCVALGLAVRMAMARAQEPSASWTVHRRVDIANMQRGPNLLKNPGFESGATNWIQYGSRFAVDSTVARSGTNSARVDSGALGAAVQKVTLNQAYAKPIYVGGWSKALNGPGGCKMTYSLYVDIMHTDGTQAYSPYYCYSGGTHDWEYVEKVIAPEKAVAWVQIWTMFQSSAGKAWFDDLLVGEYLGDIRQFDGYQVLYGAPSAPPWAGSEVLRVQSGDGLELGLTAAGGLPVSLRADGRELLDAAAVHAGGFFVRDVAADSDWIHLGGQVQHQGEALVFRGADAALALTLEATIRPGADHLLLDYALQDTAGRARAISVYFALPIAPAGWTWWKDIRTSAAATAATEHTFTLATNWGANGRMSHYCLSALSGPTGLALAYPMDRPVVSRFAYNSATRQYYFTAELGLAPQTQPPGRADVRLLLYKHDPAWGFRAAFSKYASIYPGFFVKRVADEGVWVAHADLDPILNVGDFGIKFHETGNSRVYAYDDSVNAYTLRYLTEPWGYWLRVPTNVSLSDYDAVMAHVRSQLSASAINDRRWAEAILSSGAFTTAGRYLYEGSDQPFASHVAAFTLNGDPSLVVPGYTHTKATQSWSANRLEPYYHPEWGILDGDYIDSFESHGLDSNFRVEHFAASAHPLTFDTATQRVVLPHIFSSYELAKQISGDVRGLNRYVMANSVLLRWAFPSHLFDILGSERSWIQSGRFLPDMDSLLNLWRTFSYRKPYVVLQTGDLPSLTPALVETYFQYAAFYGVYPGFFTHDGGVTNYWSRPDWYERDRAAHLKYIPIIKALNQAGWEPITAARSSVPQVYVERYGGGKTFYLAVRNSSDGAVATGILVDLARLL